MIVTHDTTSLMRQLKIDLITDAQNSIIEWFNKIWNRLSVVECDVFHKNCGELIYYIDGEKKQWMFYRHDKSGIFWCNRELYWAILESQQDVIYTDVQHITIIMLESVLNITTIPTYRRDNIFSVEQVGLMILRGIKKDLN